MHKWTLFCVAGMLTAGMFMPAVASAGERQVREDYVPLSGAVGPAPVGNNRVNVLRVGSPSARQVLVLVPGQFGAAGDFRSLARELAGRLPSTQVWAVDRREQNLADLSGFRSGHPDRAAAYYLGGQYRAQTAQTAPYVADWGLSVTLEDLRRVVLAARDGGRRQVVLGGHSWGAATALAYAAWDFDGRAGYRDLSGLVLIDGGVHDAFAGLTQGTVNTAAQWVVANSKIPAASYDGDSAMTHLDVLWADPQRNTMVRSVVPFLRQLNGR